MAKSDFYSDGSDLGLDADDGELPDLMTEELPSLSDRGLGLQRKRDLNPELDSPSKKRKTSSAAAQSLRVSLCVRYGGRRMSDGYLNSSD